MRFIGPHESAEIASIERDRGLVTRRMTFVEDFGYQFLSETSFYEKGTWMYKLGDLLRHMPYFEVRTETKDYIDIAPIHPDLHRLGRWLIDKNRLMIARRLDQHPGLTPEYSDMLDRHVKKSLSSSRNCRYVSSLGL